MAADAERANTDLVGAGRGADKVRTTFALEEFDLPNNLRLDSARTNVIFIESLLMMDPLMFRVNGEFSEDVRDKLSEEMVEEESTDFSNECSMDACGFDLTRSLNSCSHLLS